MNGASARLNSDPNTANAFVRPRDFRFASPRPIAAAAAVLALVLAMVTAARLALDYESQRHLRQTLSREYELALITQVSLGRSMEDLKNCLVRDELLYCADFDEHIALVDKSIVYFSSQPEPVPQERQLTASLRQSIAQYRAAVVGLRADPGRRPVLRDTEATIAGISRAAAEQIGELTALKARQLNTGQSSRQLFYWLALFLALAGICFYLAAPPGKRFGWPFTRSAESLRKWSDSVVDWEEHKRAHAFEKLYGSILQSLTGVMYLLNSKQPVAVGARNDLVMPSLHAAIQDTRAVALQLRPPILEEAGLLATLQSLWVDAVAQNPALTVRASMPLQDSDVPIRLHSVILRIARAAVDVVELNPLACPLVWTLERSGHTLRLAIELSDGGGRLSLGGASPLSAIQAHVALSDGGSDFVCEAGRGQGLVCLWSLGQTIL